MIREISIYQNAYAGSVNTYNPIFDYNFFFKSYAYSDIRYVCGNFYNNEARLVFLSAYGTFDELILLNKNESRNCTRAPLIVKKFTLICRIIIDVSSFP